MIKISDVFRFSILVLSLSSTSACFADGFIKKEVYSYKDKSGNTVFTDRKPIEKQIFKTQVVEAANSTGGSSVNNTQQNHYVLDRYPKQESTIKVIVEHDLGSKKKYYKKKKSLKRCKSYKKKLVYYSDKMKSGYKNSEYKRLESNRKKYRKLLFDNCETKTFVD